VKIIEVTNLTKKFNGFTAVDNISFDVNEGEIFAFLGPNGAGKSTTIKMLTTLISSNEGKIIFNENPKLSKNEIRDMFGIVFQDHSLDDELTAYENMEYHGVIYKVSKNERKKRIKEALELVELWDRKNDLVKKFSGGMKRRLEIARSLIHYPKILFLDEPTLGLDPQTRKKIWEQIKIMNKEKGMTIFMTTHYMEEAEKMAHRIAIIDHGKIKDVGTFEEYKKKYKTDSLEEVFLQITGEKIREEEPEKNYMFKKRMRR
jgi:ABC-2 type transport system ATP-binding protein